MTITAPDLDIAQGTPDDGPSLIADPWSDGWTLPTATELEAVGWPGARPPQPIPAPRPERPASGTAGEWIVGRFGDMPVEEPLRQSVEGVSTKLRKPESRDRADEPDEVIDLTEPDHRKSREPQRVHKHRRLPRSLRVVVATGATAYWYFALATLAIAVVVPLVAGWNTTTVMSNSMEPAISAGDVVAFADYDGSLLDVGTIIQFDDQVREGSTLTHRIVGVNPDGTYQTKGDANRGPDSTQVPAESIVGVTRMVSPYAGLPHFWLATGQYVWLAGWVLLTAAAATVMVPGGAAGKESARPVPEIKTRPARLQIDNGSGPYPSARA